MKKTQRVPVTLSTDEEKDLQSIAISEDRSKSKMARIIYLLGMQQYIEQNPFPQSQP